MNDLIGKLIRLHESIIDYPMAGLDLSVWNEKGDAYTLRGDVKRKIISTLKLYTDSYILNQQYESPVPHLHSWRQDLSNQH